MNRHIGYITGLIAAASAFAIAPWTPVDAQSGRPAAATGADVFSRIRCGTDVARTLVGGHLPDGRVAAIEAAHAGIALEDVGGSDITDSLFLGGWKMCGHEYQLLVRRERIEDALQFPPHSRRQPAFLGTCARHDQRLDRVLAVLDNPAPRTRDQPPYSPDDTTSLATVAAWRIDEKSRRIAAIPTDGLRCPRGGIFTRDGGT